MRTAVMLLLALLLMADIASRVIPALEVEPPLPVVTVEPFESLPFEWTPFDIGPAVPKKYDPFPEAEQWRYEFLEENAAEHNCGSYYDYKCEQRLKGVI